MVIHRGEWGPFVRIESDENKELHLRLVEDEKGSSTLKEIHDFVQNHFNSLSLDDVQIIKALRLNDEGKSSIKQIIKMVGNFFRNGFRTDAGLMKETYVYAFKKEIEESQGALKTSQLSNGSDHQVVKKQTEKVVNKLRKKIVNDLKICEDDPPELVSAKIKVICEYEKSFKMLRFKSETHINIEGKIDKAPTIFEKEYPPELKRDHMVGRSSPASFRQLIKHEVTYENLHDAFLHELKKRFRPKDVRLDELDYITNEFAHIIQNLGENSSIESIKELLKSQYKKNNFFEDELSHKEYLQLNHLKKIVKSKEKNLKWVKDELKPFKMRNVDESHYEAFDKAIDEIFEDADVKAVLSQFLLSSF